MASQAAPLKALRDFPVYIYNDVTKVQTYQSFRAGEVISDPALCEYLLSVNCPVARVDDFSKAVCPHCHSIVDRAANPATVFIARAPFNFNHDLTFYKYDIGEIIGEHILEYVKTLNVAIEEINSAAKCPSCKYLFY